MQHVVVVRIHRNICVNVAVARMHVQRDEEPPAQHTLVSLRAAQGPLRSRGWSSIVLVTDPWHSARAMMMARDLGFHTEVSSVTSGPATDPSIRNRYILRETLGTLFYRLTGGTSGAGTAVF